MFSKSSKTISLIITAFVAASLLASCASEETPELEPSIPESSIEESVTETAETTKKPTPTPTPTLTETLSNEEKTAFDYNLAWDMVSEGASDEEIIDALINEGYCKDETVAGMVLDWVRADWEDGIRAYETPQTPAPTSSSGNSGSGNSDNGDSTTTPTCTDPTTTQTSSAQTQPTSAPTEPTSAPTETQATQPTSAPTETTPAPTEAKTIQYYDFIGTCLDEQTGANMGDFTCTGSSLDNCLDQFYTYCDNHGYAPGNYGCQAVWSDGSRTYA